MEDKLEYWENIRDERISDIEAERLIGDPDNILLELCYNSLQEALHKITELNG